MFEIHPQLKNDCIVLGKFPLSLLLLKNDQTFPWFILVPMREGVQEVFQLSEDDQTQLNHESCYLARKLTERFDADKMNIAALGNVVPQLHIHHIVRYTSDAAWPNPVWGELDEKPYNKHTLKIMSNKLRQILKDDFRFL